MRRPRVRPQGIKRDTLHVRKTRIVSPSRTQRIKKEPGTVRKRLAPRKKEGNKQPYHVFFMEAGAGARTRGSRKATLLRINRMSVGPGKDVNWEGCARDKKISPSWTKHRGVVCHRCSCSPVNILEEENRAGTVRPKLLPRGRRGMGGN